MKTIVQFTQKLKNYFSEKNVVAPIEQTSTASQPYAVGKFFFYNNVLYKVTSTITAGDTIIIGDAGNCKIADPITKLIYDITNSIDIPFRGSITTWRNMTPAQKADYNSMDFDDDFDGYIVDDSPIQNSQNVVKSGGVYDSISNVKEALTNLTTDIAPIENGTNYSTSYSKGEQFIRNGLLYKVTAATVSSSTPINTDSGGNATLANCITKQLSVKTQKLTSGITNGSGSVYCSKSGKVATLCIDITPDSSGNITFILPGEYLPANNIYHKYSYTNNNVYIYGYPGNPIMTIAHSNNDAIDHVLTYITE